jgi:type I restriction enzyme S subunit
MSPFDAARYARLLEGLEVSVLRLSQVSDADNPTRRFDSSFFQKEYLHLERYPNAIGALATVRSGTTPTDRDDNLREGVVLLKTVDIQNRPLSTVDVEQYYKIASDIAKRMEKTRLLPGDVLINIVGATTDVVGRVALVPPNFPEANITQAMALIRVKESKLTPELLFSFLASKFGRSQIRRLARPTGQFNLNLPEVESIRIPEFEPLFSARIKQIVKSAQAARDASREQLAAAELLLSQALGIKNLGAPEPLSYVRRSTEAFAAGRLDAEYFSPRVLALMKLLGRDGLTIGQVAPARHEVFDTTKVGKTFTYIEIGDMRADGTVDASELDVVDAPSRATQYVRRGDVLTSTVRPIRRLSAAVDSAQDGAVCSSGFVVLQPFSISTNTLVTYLRLPLVCQLMDLHTSASLYPAISEKDLLGLPIPSISISTQTAVDHQVAEAHTAKQRAEKLLDAAKRAVEIAIEDGESAALKYLEAFQ